MSGKQVCIRRDELVVYLFLSYAQYIYSALLLCRALFHENPILQLIYIYRLTHPTSELSGFICTSLLTIINNVKSYVLINPLTAEWALRTLMDFTLSSARRFYSSKGNPLDGKGLSRYKLSLTKKTAHMRYFWTLSVWERADFLVGWF